MAKTLCIDTVCAGALWRAAWRRPAVLWHVEPLSTSGARWLAGFRGFGLLRAEVRQVPVQMGEVRDARGALQYRALLQDARRLCEAIRQEQLERHPLVLGMAAIWAPRRTAFYLEKLSELELRRECLRVGLAAWMASREDSNEATLLIRRPRWQRELDAYAAAHGVRLLTYRAWPQPARWFRLIRRAAAGAGRIVARVGSIRPKQAGITASQGAPRPVIALRYWHRSLSLDPLDRSEFFWLDRSITRQADVLLYSPDGPISAEEPVRRQLKTEGITLLDGGPRLSGRALRHAARLAARIAGLVLAEWRKGSAVALSDVTALLRLAVADGKWRDFFSAHRVRVHVSAFNYQPTDVALTMALESLHGVSIGYDYSISGLLMCPMAARSAGEHVQVVFSPYFERLWRHIGAPVDRFVPAGYLYDGAFERLRQSERVTGLRRQLGDRGAKFILCFFDENSSDALWDRYASNAAAARDYEMLLQWVLDDPVLGLIIKVKQSKTFFGRFSKLRPLIEQTERTGRCRLLMDCEAVVGRIFPAEAALAADLCVGKLSGSTAAFEARLAGMPTLLIDTEGFTDHPLRALGQRAVFDGWEALRQAVARYRAGDRSIGDWEPLLGELEPFQDGRAADRMRSHIAGIAGIPIAAPEPAAVMAGSS